MTRLNFVLAVLVSLLLARFFDWPLPRYTVVDPLYETVGLNRLNLVLDFLVLFLVSAVIVGVLEILLTFFVLKSIFNESKS